MAEHTTDLVFIGVLLGVALFAFGMVKLIGRKTRDDFLELEEDLASLREGLGDDHPAVQDFQKQLDEIREEMRDLL